MSVLYLIIPLIQDIIIVMLIIKSVSVRKERRSEEKRSHVVYLDPGIMWFGSFFVGALCVPVTLLEPGEMSAGVWWVFEFFIILFILVFVALINSHIYYNDSKIEVSNIFGKKRVYSYEEITGIAGQGKDHIIYCGQKKIAVDGFSVGGKEFIECADREFARLTGEEIPRCEPKRDPMNGNVSSPWFIIILFSIMLAGSLGLLGFSLYRILSGSENVGVSIALIICGVALLALSVISFLVCRHPERYPAWLCKLVLSGFFWAPDALKNKKNTKK